MITSPRPRPDKIIRHQIVFGEADRKILSAAVDSYNLNTIVGNATKILNDVTGTITFLTLLSVSGLLGVIFAFQINPIHLATGNIPEIMKDFGFQWDDALAEAREKKQDEADARRAGFAEQYRGDGTPSDYVEAALNLNPFTKPLVSLYDRIQLDNIGPFDNPFKD